MAYGQKRMELGVSSSLAWQGALKGSGNRWMPRRAGAAGRRDIGIVSIFECVVPSKDDLRRSLLAHVDLVHVDMCGSHVWLSAAVLRHSRSRVAMAKEEAHIISHCDKFLS